MPYKIQQYHKQAFAHTWHAQKVTFNDKGFFGKIQPSDNFYFIHVNFGIILSPKYAILSDQAVRTPIGYIGSQYALCHMLKIRI